MMKAVEWLGHRIRNMAALARINTTTQAAGVMRAQLQLGTDDVRDNTPVLSLYGLAARPLAGADALVIFLGGDRGAGVVVATGDRRHQGPALAEGEVALFHHAGNAWVILTNDGKLTVKSSVQVVVESPAILLGGTGASKFVKLADGSNSTTTKAL